jgi:hypothetical protein
MLFEYSRSARRLQNVARKPSQSSRGRNRQRGAVMSGVKISKSDAEWRQQLTPEQIRVIRQHGTGKRYCMNGAALSFEAAATDGRSR